LEIVVLEYLYSLGSYGAGRMKGSSPGGGGSAWLSRGAILIIIPIFIGLAMIEANKASFATGSRITFKIIPRPGNQFTLFAKLQQKG